MPRIPYKSLTQSDELSEKLEMSTAEIGLSVRTTNCLEEKGIFTMRQVRLLHVQNRFGTDEIGQYIANKKETT